MKQDVSVSVLRERKTRARKVLRSMKRLFPNAAMSLTYQNPWELMVAVQLSAQCTDKRVNEVTPKLFKRYKTLREYCDADPDEFSRLIYSTGFYRNKTKNILAAAKMLHERFHGKLPKTMHEMLELPGVARKTANVVLGNVYHIAEGIAVDTHVKRIARVLGLTEHTSPVAIERELMVLYPQKEWFQLTYYFIEFGRKYCPARKHNHRACEKLLGISHFDS